MNIKIEKLSLKYDKFSALKNITCTLSDQKIYGLLGRNGAGKTSLLSIIASYREATGGTILINGEYPFENPKIMQQVAFFYEGFFNKNDETDNIIAFIKNVSTYRPNFDIDYAMSLIEQFKIDKDKQIAKLSKGMQSAVNVIIGLACRAPITIFDEVYLGMDAPARDLFYKELLKEQEKYPRMIILSTHLVSEMDYLFDEVIILHDGKILLQDEYDEIVTKGRTIIGEAKKVDEFVDSKNVIHEQYLGNTKAVTIYDNLDEEKRHIALQNSLEIANVSLQDLFIHLTKEDRYNETK